MEAHILKKILSIFFIALFSSCSTPNLKNKYSENFVDYKARLYKIAQEQNFNQEIIDKSFALIKPSQQQINLDKKQFKKKTFSEYYSNAVNHARIKKAKKKLAENRSALNKVEKQYGLPKHYIVSLWGIESDFGHKMGSFNVINSLFNLAFEGRRRELFQDEFFAGLEILNQGDISPRKFKGSWAGAMGQCQFMPSTYLSYAEDGNGNGTEDIWHEKADVFASIANYITKLGWDNKIPWGYEAIGDKKLERLANRDKRYNLGKIIDKYNLKKLSGEGFSEYERKQEIGLIEYERKYFVAFKNFYTIRKWNRSNYFALTIGIFAEDIK